MSRTFHAALLAGALTTGLTPSLLHATPREAIVERAPAPAPVVPVSPLAVAASSAAVAGAMEALGEVGALAMRDLASRPLADFRGGARDTIVISTTTLLVVIIVLLVLIIVF